MTVLGPIGKISWKVSVPLCLLVVGLIVAMWLLPLPLKVEGTVAFSFLILGILTWTFFGDTDE